MDKIHEQQFRWNRDEESTCCSLAPSRGTPSEEKTRKDPPFTRAEWLVARGATRTKSGKQLGSSAARRCVRMGTQCEFMEGQQCSTSTRNSSGTLGSCWSGSARRWGYLLCCCELKKWHKYTKKRSFVPTPWIKPCDDGIPCRWMRLVATFTSFDRYTHMGKLRTAPRRSHGKLRG